MYVFVSVDSGMSEEIFGSAALRILYLAMGAVLVKSVITMCDASAIACDLGMHAHAHAQSQLKIMYTYAYTCTHVCTIHFAPVVVLAPRGAPASCSAVCDVSSRPPSTSITLPVIHPALALSAAKATT